MTLNLNIHHKIKEKLKYFHSIHKIPNIIFHGASGSGKRTIVNDFINLIYGGNKNKMQDFVMYVNCAHGKGIKFIREELKFFAKTHINSNGGDIFKSIIMLNADKLTIDAQSALRRCIELFSHNTRFFIIVEDKYKLLKPILSRFCEIYVPEPIHNGVKINLYKHNIDDTFKLKALATQNSEWLKKTLLKETQFPEKKLTKEEDINIVVNVNAEDNNDKFDGDCDDKSPYTDKNCVVDAVAAEGDNKTNDSTAVTTTDATATDDATDKLLLYNKLVELSVKLYEKSYSALDIIALLENHSFLPELKMEKRYELLICFNKIKKEFRNEKLLIMFVLNFLFMSSNISLENISFM